MPALVRVIATEVGPSLTLLLPKLWLVTDNCNEGAAPATDAETTTAAHSAAIE